MNGPHATRVLVAFAFLTLALTAPASGRALAATPPPAPADIPSPGVPQESPRRPEAPAPAQAAPSETNPDGADRHDPRAEAVPALFTIRHNPRVRHDLASEASRAALDPGSDLDLSPAHRSGRSWRVGDRWTLPVSEAGTAILHVDRVRIAADNTVEIEGHLENLPGTEVLLTQSDEAIAATIRRPGLPMLRVLPTAGPGHRLHTLEPESAPLCGNGPGRSGGLRLANGHPAKAGPGDADAVLDLAFFFTPAAEAGAGGPAGMQALLALAVLEANDAFRRSDARLQIRPVCRFAIEYAESGDLATDLDRLGRSGDGFMDEIHALRDAHAADVVCLIVESESTRRLAGMANQLTDTSAASLARGFLACVRPYLVGNYTLPHEIGHVLGCNHDRDHAGGSGLEAWSYGARISADGVQYRTVMAYRPGLQFPHFSNPRVTFRGVPTGTAFEDNARTLQRTAPMVAAIREPLSRLGFAQAAVEVLESSGTLSLPFTFAGPETLPEADVHIRTVAGSAREEIDFGPLDLRASWVDGGVTPAVEVVLRDNATVDGPRHFAVELRSPAAGLALGPISTLTVTVLDDELEAASPLDASFRTRPGADYVVSALAVTAQGEVLAAGGFTRVNGVPQARVARLLADGTPDPRFQGGAKYQVLALTPLPDGKTAIAGEFNTVHGIALHHVAILRGDGTPDPGFAFEPGTDGVVRALAAATPDGLFIGGDFTQVQGRPARNVALLQANGAASDALDPTQSPDGEVLALRVDAQGRLLVGGRFRTVGGTASDRLARLVPGGGRDGSFEPPQAVDAPVHALAFDSTGRILAAGDFTTFHGRPAGRLARLAANGAWDETFQAGVGANGPIRALAVASDDAIWVGGGFTRFDGQLRNRVARLSPDGSLDAGFDPGIGPNDWVRALALGLSDAVVIGGSFTSVNGIPRGGVAAWLTTPIRSPAFVRFEPAREGLAWEAFGLPRQPYRLQESTDLKTWTTLEESRSPGTRHQGVWTPPSDRLGAAFLRLERRLE